LDKTARYRDNDLFGQRPSVFSSVFRVFSTDGTPIETTVNEYSGRFASLWTNINAFDPGPFLILSRIAGPRFQNPRRKPAAGLFHGSALVLEIHIGAGIGGQWNRGETLCD